ncbi:hypothetical protein HF1_01620 [Mycoplasma haemofelis str. Langford 1]|uniref:Uncharacterized protein n=2 Tax=Mycoplasma haemofelis TaxID=29501 RepID=F6FG16_MYCHI|nr:hypothetical protein [Mycoplasma haemofelis]AEG72482.1 hypothetical protein MHF_0183 [Mycoplasma haemofelis Ohio2]CBY92170.1 hypothetical protein HF1_01620 [Mycoplasma haemofelis str. Langford 1]
MTGKMLAGIGAAGTASGAGMGGMYLYTKDSIGNQVKDRVLGTGQEFNDSWKFKFKQMKEESQDGFPELENIKTQHSNNEETGAAALKDWCSKSYSYVYKSVFSSKDDSRLKKVEKYCIQSLGEKFTSLLTGNHKLLGNGANENQSEYSTNFNKIQNYDEATKGKLPSELKDLKSAEASTKWTVLQGWCKKIQSIPFTEEGDIFKVGKELCIKTS